MIVIIKLTQIPPLRFAPEAVFLDQQVPIFELSSVQPLAFNFWRSAYKTVIFFPSILNFIPACSIIFSTSDTLLLRLTIPEKCLLPGFP